MDKHFIFQNFTYKCCLVVSIFTLTAFSVTEWGGNDELEASIKRGKQVYNKNCLTCHMDNGEGIPGVYPPLAKADYLLEDIDRAIHQTLAGAKGEMEVNGITYTGEMPPQNLNDREMADVMNYILHSWGNEGEEITVERVKKVRAEIE